MVAAKQASKQKWLSGGILHKIANMPEKNFRCVLKVKRHIRLKWVTFVYCPKSRN